MAARHGRRRRAAPRRRLRRWFRRQDRLTRLLFFTVIGLGVLIAALTLPLRDRERGARRASRPPAARQASPSTTARASAPARSAAKPRKEPPAPPRTAVRAALPAPARPAGEAAAPRAAIVFDDLGQRLSHLEQLASLQIPLTIAVIPGLPATAATVREASRLGIQMLLHQPMEPREEVAKDPGAGVLLASMGTEEVRGRLSENLAAVPGAVGVNNHMGSRFTEEAAGLAAVMAELKARGLFWLDSRTTPATRGTEIARGAGVRAIERDIFLDAEVSAEFVRGQVRRLLATARERGTAVAIGHPHPETIATLKELRAELLDSGVQLVPLSALLPAAGVGTALAAATDGAGRSRPGRTAPAAHP